LLSPEASGAPVVRVLHDHSVRTILVIALLDPARVAFSFLADWQVKSWH
jgi:hypothetical protein